MVICLSDDCEDFGGWVGGWSQFEDRQWVIVRAPYLVPRNLKQIFETHNPDT